MFGTVLSISQRPLFSVIYMLKYKIENAKASSIDVKPVVVTIRIPITWTKTYESRKVFLKAA